MESSIFSLVVQLVVYEIILRRKTDYWSVTVYETAESCLDKNNREQDSCLIPRFTPVGREGRSNSHFHIWQTRQFQFLYLIFRSWVAICNLSPPVTALYAVPRYAPHMNVLFWGSCDFPISFSDRDTSYNAWNHHWGSSMVDTRILLNSMKFPSNEL